MVLIGSFFAGSRYNVWCSWIPSLSNCATLYDVRRYSARLFLMVSSCENGESSTYIGC